MALGIAFAGGMTVKDLRESIDDLPDDMRVFMAGDEEGNSYYSLYSTDIHLFDLAEREPLDEDEWDENDDTTEKVLLLWP